MNAIEKHEDLIYDVGMNTGQDTDFYLKKGFRVIGFEADPDNVEFCRERFAEAVKSGQLTVVSGAITENTTESVKFYKNLDHRLWGSTSEDFAARNEVMGTAQQVIEVEAVDFAKCLETYGIPHYLKADIVGSETICLRAMLNFENKPDYISIRSEKVIFRNLETEFDLLEKLGYDKFKAIQQDFTRLKPFIDGEKYTFEEGASGTFGEETKGNWKTREQVLKDYRKIFTFYWLFGDYSYMNQTEKGKKFIAQLERIARRPLPGWYDTHAKHSSKK